METISHILYRTRTFKLEVLSIKLCHVGHDMNSMGFHWGLFGRLRVLIFYLFWKWNHVEVFYSWIETGCLFADIGFKNINHFLVLSFYNCSQCSTAWGYLKLTSFTKEKKKDLKFNSLLNIAKYEFGVGKTWLSWNPSPMKNSWTDLIHMQKRTPHTVYFVYTLCTWIRTFRETMKR